MIEWFSNMFDKHPVISTVVISVVCCAVISMAVARVLINRAQAAKAVAAITTEETRTKLNDSVMKAANEQAQAAIKLPKIQKQADKPEKPEQRAIPSMPANNQPLAELTTLDLIYVVLYVSALNSKVSPQEAHEYARNRAIDHLDGWGPWK